MVTTVSVTGGRLARCCSSTWYDHIVGCAEVSCEHCSTGCYGTDLESIRPDLCEGDAAVAQLCADAVPVLLVCQVMTFVIVIRVDGSCCAREVLEASFLWLPWLITFYLHYVDVPGLGLRCCPGEGQGVAGLFGLKVHVVAADFTTNCWWSRSI